MHIRKYTCPKCGYTKVPITNKGCGGFVVKVGNRWMYNACGEKVADYIVCTKRSHIFKCNWVEVDLTFINLVLNNKKRGVGSEVIKNHS